MTEQKKSTRIIDHFRDIQDPRISRNRLHSLLDIIAIGICGALCGCEGWEEIEMYARHKEPGLAKFLKLTNGIPSHDTIRRVFVRLNPEQLYSGFMSWVEAIRTRSDGEVVSIDGKKARRSYDSAKGIGALYLVSAWSHENRLVLGQVKTAEKSNEISAINDLLEVLKLSGCIVTIDAIGCNSAIATKIKKNRGADYVLAVKGNQPKLHEEIKWFFDDLDLVDDVTEGLADHHRSVDTDHGRVEIRDCYASEEIDWLKPLVADWHGVKSIAMVTARRWIAGKESSQTRYYISSLKADAEQIAHAVRSHWGIENSVHWVLDMGFREDESRIRTPHSPENLAILRKIAMNLVRRDTGSKYSLRLRRRKAGWDDEYLEKLLFAPDSDFPPASK